MSIAPEQQSVRVIISADRMTAELHADPNIDRTMLNEPLCVSILMEAGIELTDTITKEISRFIKKATETNKQVTHTIAKGIAATDGIDGTVDWFVDKSESTSSQQTQSNMSHYEKCAFVMVNQGDVLGQYLMPQPGHDGRDVTGKTVPAKEPLNCKYQFDETIITTTSNQLIAQTSGVLKRDNNNVTIEKLLIVDDNVDFSTGNINFNGDIEIKRDIRDRFVVESTGNISVHGFIEDASIFCGGNLTIQKGYAGRTRADATVQGNLNSHYLDNVDIEIFKNLQIQKEAINSRLIVHGTVECPTASLIGGSLTTTQRITVASLGSEGNITTTITLGSVPRLQPLADELDGYIQQFISHRFILNEQIEILNNISTSGSLSPHDAERHTEYMFDMMQVDLTLNKAKPTLNNLNDKINQYRKIELNVIKAIYPGVQIEYEKRIYKIGKTINGPVSIVEDAQHNLVIQKNKAKPLKLSEYATVTQLT